MNNFGITADMVIPADGFTSQEQRLADTQKFWGNKEDVVLKEKVTFVTPEYAPDNASKMWATLFSEKGYKLTA